MLGRPYEVRGVVEAGDQRGRQIGFPTANIPVPKVMAWPADAVYAGWCTRANGERHPCAINIGRRPTFYEHAEQSLLEAHLIDLRVICTARKSPSPSSISCEVSASSTDSSSCPNNSRSISTTPERCCDACRVDPTHQQKEAWIDVHRFGRRGRHHRSVAPVGEGARVTIAASTVLGDVEMGASIAVNGCCLTVVEWGTTGGPPTPYPRRWIARTSGSCARRSGQPRTSTCRQRPLRRPCRSGSCRRHG